MNLLNLCLRIPNLGILLFFLIFIVIIPYILILNNSIIVLKFYLPMLVAFANLLTIAGKKEIFEDLYELKPKNFISFLSSNFINLFALFGILWQCLEYSKSNCGTVTKAVIYGTILFIIAFPFARNGLHFILNNVDLYLREKTDLSYEYNWHLLVFGLLYIIFLLGFQAVLLALVDSSNNCGLNNSNNSVYNNLGKKNNKNNLYKLNTITNNLNNSGRYNSGYNNSGNSGNNNSGNSGNNNSGNNNSGNSGNSGNNDNNNSGNSGNNNSGNNNSGNSGNNNSGNSGNNNSGNSGNGTSSSQSSKKSSSSSSSRKTTTTRRTTRKASSSRS